MDPAQQLYEEGKRLYYQGKLPEALEAFDRAIELDPNYAPPHNGRGNALRDLNRYEDALEAYNRAIELDPNYAPPHNNRGNTLSDLNRHEEALEAFDRSIELDPNKALPHHGRGAALYNLNRHEEALEAYDRAIELDPNDALPHHGRGIVLSDLNRPEEALEAFDRAIELDPNDAAVHNGRGIALYNLNRHEEALATYDRAIELDPNIAIPHFGRGNALSNLNRHEEAFEAYDRAIELNPNFAAPWFGLGKLLLKLEGVTGDAEACFLRFYALANDNSFRQVKRYFLKLFEDRFNLPLFVLRVFQEHPELESFLSFQTLWNDSRQQCAEGLRILAFINSSDFARPELEKHRLDGLITYYLGDPFAAEQKFQDALELQVDDLMSFYYMLRSALDYKAVDRAYQARALKIVRERRRVKLSPDDAYYAGLILYEFDQYRHALPFFQQSDRLHARYMEMLMLNELEDARRDEVFAAVCKSEEDLIDAGQSGYLQGVQPRVRPAELMSTLKKGSAPFRIAGHGCPAPGELSHGWRHSPGRKGAEP